MSATSRLPASVLAPLLAAATTACAGSETGNGRKDADPEEIWLQLGLGDRPPSSPVSLSDGGGASYRLASATGVVSGLVIHLDLDPGECNGDGAWRCDSNGDEGALELGGPFEVDLLGGGLLPQVRTPGNLLPEEVRAFKVKWGGGEAPTLDVRGTVQLAGEAEARPFGLALDFHATTRFVVGASADDPGARAPGGPHAAWRLALDPSSWFEGVDLSSCVADGLVPVDADGLLRLEGAERWCRTLPVGIANGFRHDGTARVGE